MASPNAASDMADFFDFGEAAMPDVSQEANLTDPGIQATEKYVSELRDNFGIMFWLWNSLQSPEPYVILI